MKPELLELFIKLQPFFKKRVGDWRIGDMFSVEGSEQILFAVRECIDGMEENFSIINWFPLTIDPINPERGLWGMLDWTRFSEYKMILNNGKLHLSFGNQEYIEDTPTEAILKALVVLEELI